MTTIDFEKEMLKSKRMDRMLHTLKELYEIGECPKEKYIEQLKESLTRDRESFKRF